MPKIHNPDWSSLKLTDFPQFRCLCDLCDCGCFERSKKKHTPDCKKRITKISNAFDSSFVNPLPTEKGSLYRHTYKNFVYDSAAAADSNETAVVPDSPRLTDEYTLKVPKKHGPKEGSIELPEKEVKLSSNTTNKDHFKNWRSAPAKAIPEHPEFAGNLMYPTEKREHMTTNAELFFKNYGKYKAKSSALNIFENQFKINQGKNMMDLDTMYTHDYHKLNIKDIIKERGPHVTKEMVEKRATKMIKKLPMDTLTVSRNDYRFDPEAFKSQAQIQKQNNLTQSQNELFKSKLNNGMKPLEDNTNFIYPPPVPIYDTSYNLSYRDKSADSLKEKSQTFSLDNQNFGESHLSHKNIRYLATFDNRYVPSLKVLKTIPKLNKIPPIKSESAGAGVLDDNSIDLQTIYKEDFKDRGIDVCMAKAYSAVLAQSNKSALF